MNKYNTINSVFRLNRLFFSSLIFLFIILRPAVTFSQDSDDGSNKKIAPIIALSNVIKYSNATFKNNIPYDGSVYGYINGEKILLTSFLSLDTVTVEILNYDSLNFYSEFVTKEGKPLKLDYTIQVDSNKLFEYVASPIMQMSGADLTIGNNQLKNLFLPDGTGKKLYSVTITDDVNPNRIKVEPMNDASEYIIVDKIDSANYQIKIKNKDLFIGNLSENIRRLWSKGELIRFPIGVIITDTVVPNHVATIQYTLVKKKKPKKVKN